MKRHIAWIWLWSSLYAVAAPVNGDRLPPVSPLRPAAASRPVGSGEYRLGPQDVLVVRVARHEELGAEVTVLDDGRIMLPRIGELQVAEHTPQEVQELVATGLKKVLVAPEVSVVVKIPRPILVYVSGAVRTPRGVEMRPGWRVSEALAEAGGLLVKPERARATLFRRPNQTVPVDLARIYIAQDASANLELQPGDNLDVEEEPTRRIYISGAVLKAGPVELPKGEGITEAISLAGGVTPQAALSRTMVQRLSGEQVTVDMDRVLNQGQPPPGIRLDGGDQIIIPENRQHVAVLGWVKTPGLYPLHDGRPMSVAEAISLAGGADSRGRLTSIGVIRLVDGQSKVTTVNLRRVLQKGSADQNVALQDGDVVYVPETEKPDWSKILPGAQAIGSLWYFLSH